MRRSLAVAMFLGLSLLSSMGASASVVGPYATLISAGSSQQVQKVCCGSVVNGNGVWVDGSVCSRKDLPILEYSCNLGSDDLLAGEPLNTLAHGDDTTINSNKNVFITSKPGSLPSYFAGSRAVCVHNGEPTYYVCRQSTTPNAPLWITAAGGAPSNANSCNFGTGADNSLNPTSLATHCVSKVGGNVRIIAP